jgi:hypothetical protein
MPFFHDTQKDNLRPHGRRTVRTLIFAALAVLVLGSFTTVRAFSDRDDDGHDDGERFARPQGLAAWVRSVS